MMRFWRSILALILATQPILLSAASASAGVDSSHILCLPGGSSADAQSAFEGLLDDLGLSQEEPAPSAEHCPTCQLAHGAPLPEIDLASAPVAYLVKTDRPQTRPEISHQPQGPPTGLRAPPLLSI